MRDTQVRYQKAQGRKEKSRLLRQVSETLGCHKKHAGRLMRGKSPPLEQPFRHREPVYPERLIRILEEIWKATQYLWSVRLKAALPLWLPWIEKRWTLGAEEAKLLLAMSPATMDRRLGAYKRRLRSKIYGKTKPGLWLRQTIPIQTESWNVPEPGWMEADTVSHSGPSAQGLFAYTLNQVDFFSGWVAMRAILGKSAEEVVTATEKMRRALPFEQKGIDSDNGEEFINWHLTRYCQQTGLTRFRSRPNKKDDQAHIEQKNGTHVRRLIGWDRYDTQQAVAAMNDLYEKEWNLLPNLFLPSVKLANKIRVGSRIKRIYADAKTPLDRLRDSDKGNREKIEALFRLRKRLDPFELAQQVDKKLEKIWSLASRTRLKAAPRPYVPPRRLWFKEESVPPPLSVPFQNNDIDRMRKMCWRDRFFSTN